MSKASSVVVRVTQ